MVKRCRCAPGSSKGQDACRTGLLHIGIGIANISDVLGFYVPGVEYFAYGGCFNDSIGVAYLDLIEVLCEIKIVERIGGSAR